MLVPGARPTDPHAGRPTNEPRPRANVTRPTSETQDHIDRSLPQGDVYFSWAKGAAWDAFFLRRDSGMLHGIGPKPPEQMAFIIKRALRRSADGNGVPMLFHATKSGGDVRVAGRDANRSGPDVIVSRNGSVAITTTQYGVENRVLGVIERWHPERHDTGYLEKHSRAWPRDAPWMAAYPESNMTGKNDM
ncbi:MAG: hypothetical protein NVS2B8_18520 [Vulcanimicrobiaceae bacterium]